MDAEFYVRGLLGSGGAPKAAPPPPPLVARQLDAALAEGLLDAAAAGIAPSVSASSAGKLLEVQDGQGEPRPEDVLEKCVGIATALSELLQQAGSGDLSLEEVQSDAQESAEMMMLFQLEKDEDAAVDAVG